MNEAQAYEAIAQRWSTAWTASQPAIPFVLGNDAYPSQGVARFVALSFGPLASKRLSQGQNPKLQHRGTVMVKLFGPLDAGEAATLLLSVAVKAALEDRTITIATGDSNRDVSLWVAPATVSAKQGSWWTRLVTIPFTFYEQR